MERIVQCHRWEIVLKWNFGIHLPGDSKRLGIEAFRLAWGRAGCGFP